jgi:hypothetical protein
MSKRGEPTTAVRMIARDEVLRLAKRLREEAPRTAYPSHAREVADAVEALAKESRS